MLEAQNILEKSFAKRMHGILLAHHLGQLMWADAQSMLAVGSLDNQSGTTLAFAFSVLNNEAMPKHTPTDDDEDTWSIRLVELQGGQICNLIAEAFASCMESVQQWSKVGLESAKVGLVGA